MGAPRHHPICAKSGHCIGVDAGCVRAAYDRRKGGIKRRMRAFLRNEGPRTVATSGTLASILEVPSAWMLAIVREMAAKGQLRKLSGKGKPTVYGLPQTPKEVS